MDNLDIFFDPINQTSTLILNNVTGSSGGVYSCIVSNPAGRALENLTLSIFPYFVLEPQDGGGEDGENVTLQCVAGGFPEPQYQWFRQNLMSVGSTSELEFAPLRFGDEGLYSCEVTSGEHNITSDIVTLWGKSRVMLTYFLSNTQYYFSSTPSLFSVHAVLSCSVSWEQRNCLIDAERG